MLEKQKSVLACREVGNSWNCDEGEPMARTGKYGGDAPGMAGLALRATAAAAVAVALVVAWSGAARAQEYEGRRHIAVSGEGSVRVRPDVAHADLGIRVTGETVGEAMGEARRSMERVLDALKQAGVAEGDVTTSRFAIRRERVPIPRRGGPDEGKVEERYAVNNMVRVTIRDLDRAGAVLDHAIDAGANEVHGVRFAIEEEDEVAAEARQLAAARARAKAEQLARLHGVALGEPIRIAEAGTGPGPGPMYARAAGMSAESATVSVGELTFSVRLDVVYEIEAD